MILIALGANLPGRFSDARAALMAGADAMQQHGIDILKLSRIYVTRPVPASDQPWYHNAIAAVATTLSPLALLERLQSIEHDLGRVRTTRNAPRVIDLDLIAYNDVVLDRPELIIPHPRAHQRAFVLRPLADVAPDWVHPVTGTPLATLIANLPPDQIATPE